MTDVFYPTLDHSNVQDLQFVIVDKAQRAELERDATTHRIEQADPEALVYRQINDKPSRYRITKTVVTDPARSTILMDVDFRSLDGAPYQLYALYNPSLGNSALHDRGRTDAVDHGLSASERTFNSYLKAAHGATFGKMSNGYSANNDGWTDLKDDGQMDVVIDDASEGNVVQTAQLTPTTPAPSFGFQLALGFGDSAETAKAAANATLATSGGFAKVQEAYVKGWKQYLSALKPPPNSVASDSRLAQVYRTSVMALHAGEDKKNPGAQVAALATPWGDQKFGQANNDVIHDYHAVWSRDAYQQATGLLAAGDREQADRILTFLLTKQQIREGPQAGEFPRFSTVDGSDLGGDHQMDEAAFPVILAWQLGHKDAGTWRHIERIANRIAAVGPATGTERWEEQGGLSPSTIAAEITALICAADLARAQTPAEEETAKGWERKADEWRRQLPFWTFVDSGPLGDGKYYERVELKDQPNPNDDDVRTWVGGHRPAKEKEVVDSGFLELVRLGVESADDPKIVGSLSELDAKTAADLPGGRYYYRYNKGLDGYGEEPSGKGWTGSDAGFGRPWPVLTVERGEYELAAGRSASSQLTAMAASANDGNLIPEQVWDTTDIPAADLKKGQPTGSATPLGWAAGQFVRLAQSIDAGRPVETPSIVAARYVRPVVDVTFSTSSSPASSASSNRARPTGPRTGCG